MSKPSSSVSTVVDDSTSPSEDARAQLEESSRKDNVPRDIEHIIPPPLDIEHVLVDDDPRIWANNRKTAILGVIAFTAMSGTVSTNIFFPAIDSLRSDLGTTETLIAVSVSLFIFFQGATPMLWSALSEVKGRRLPYIVSLLLYCAATAGCSRAGSIGAFIILRILQASGSSAVLALGAGTLSDIYDSHERGTKLGIYYMLPLLGPSIAPLVGGGLTASGSWRSAFYFLVGYGVICLILMLWLPETFRKERSLAWRTAMQSAQAHARQKAMVSLKLANIEAPSTLASLPSTLLDPSPSQMERNEAAPAPLQPILTNILSRMSLKRDDDSVKIRLRDINPFSAVGILLSQRHNIVATLVSGLLFAAQYAIAYTVAVSFAAPPYNYGSVQIGLVLLAFGMGNIVGSVFGGRYSDRVLRRLKETNGGVSEPEMRIRSTTIAMFFIPTSMLVYAWAVQFNVNLAVPIIALFTLGTGIIWVYSSTLAFIVDANPGRSSSAVACNSLARGSLAAVASLISEPLIGAVSNGQGWFYTGFAVVLTIALLSLTLVASRGKAWREKEEKTARKWKERQREQKLAKAERTME